MLVFLFFFFDVVCWASISPMGGGLGFFRLVFRLFLFYVRCWASILSVWWVRVFDVGH